VIRENIVVQKTLSRILGCALLLYGSTALAFTLILPPQEQLSPSNTITDATTLEPQVQTIASTIRTQLYGMLRPKGSTKSAQAGRVLAANAFSSTRSDVDFLAVAPGDGSGGGDGSDGSGSDSLWISGTTSSLENTFYRTAFYGATHNLLAGYDFTKSDKYVFGVSLGYEASNFTTTFNTGNERTRGYNLNPYFAWLLSDSWSVDVIGGYGDFNTRQSRTLGSATPPATVAIDSEFSSTRGFVSANLTNVSAWGNWKLTSSLGALASKRKQDAYMESNGTAVPAAETSTVEQYNLLGELAYGRGSSEAFLGALYENTRDPQKIQFASGDQPANDPDSVMLTAGWRHFGKGLTANFVFNTRVAQDQVKEYGFSMLLRVGL
jgi:hypothetical protein